MRTAKLIAVVATVGMIAIIIHGFVAGDFGAEGRRLLDMPWGRVSLVDLFSGFLLAGAWIGWRERSIIRAIPWWVAIVVLGNLTVAVYVLAAAVRSESVTEILIGRRTNSTSSVDQEPSDRR